jgi:hypothetical protein
MKLIRGLFLGIILTFSVFTVSGQAASLSSPATSDVLKLAKAGVGDDVLLSFVQNEKAPFRLSTDDILALKEAKVGGEVIKAMLNHDAAVTTAVTAPAQVVAPTPAPAAPTVVLDPDPTPPVVVVPSYPWYYHPWYYHRRVYVW